MRGRVGLGRASVSCYLEDWLWGRVDQCVDQGSGERVVVAGWEQRVDVAAAYRVFDGSDDGAGVVVGQEACYPSDSEAAGDQAAGGERVAGDRDDVRDEAGITAGLDEESFGGRHDPVGVGELVE